ncbi:MAG: hypothetical protein FWG45_03365 [Oscillospiraceae bacterium]|nr:hypothetical protein [Oscillospiraceae bacterium]
MNRRDFYKELMQEYTFDSAKVRRTAKLSCLNEKASRFSGRVRGNRKVWHIPVTAAVAAFAIILGLQVTVFDRFGDNPAVRTDADRINEANNAVAKLATMNFGTSTLFLSFSEPVTFTEMQNALDGVSDTGNIAVEAVYLLDNDNKVTMLDPIQAFKLGNPDDVRIIGAKVSAPVVLVDGLRKRAEVALVEVMSDDLNEDTFIPLIPDVDGTTDTTEGDSTGEHDHVTFEAFVNLNMVGVNRAEFIDENRFMTITSDAVGIYEIARDDETDEPTIVTISNFEAHGEIVFTYYDDMNNQLVIRVREANVSSIYFMGGEDFAAVKVARDNLTILAIAENCLYYAVDHSVVYKYTYGVGSSELFSFDAPVSFERNSNLSAFIVNSGDSDETGAAQVYDTHTESMTYEVSGWLFFYRNSVNVVTGESGFYGLNLAVISEPDTVAQFAQSRTRSELYTISEINESGVKIRLS